MTAKANLAASVVARLFNRSKSTGDDYQTLLTSYCLERFLYRLGVSDLRGRFVLKGAMLLRLWSDRPYRATRDLDLLRRGDGAPDAIRADIRAVVATPVPADAVTFGGDRIRIQAIRAEDEYAGTRAILHARCGTARFSLQIDMGLGDAVWPTPQACTYPTLLDFPAPSLLAYPREAVVAEKLEAIVALGDRNSRIKDFFDLHYLAGHFEFDRGTPGRGRTTDLRAPPHPHPGGTPDRPHARLLGESIKAGPSACLRSTGGPHGSRWVCGRLRARARRLPLPVAGRSEARTEPDRQVAAGRAVAMSAARSNPSGTWLQSTSC